MGALVVLASNVLTDADVRLGELNVQPSAALVLGVLALATGISAYRKGERSFVLWIGLLPGILFGLLLIAEVAFIE